MTDLTRPVTLLILFLLVMAGDAAAQNPTQPAAAGPSSFDLADIFELGRTVTDPNGDSVPDFVNAALVMGPSPSAAARPRRPEP